MLKNVVKLHVDHTDTISKIQTGETKQNPISSVNKLQGEKQLKEKPRG